MTTKEEPTIKTAAEFRKEGEETQKEWLRREIMKCPKCKADLTRKQEFDLIYGKDGKHQITCEKCSHRFVIVRKFKATKK